MTPQHKSEPLGRKSDERQPERLPQFKTLAGSETNAPTYSVRGRFASRRALPIVADLTNRASLPASHWPRWQSSAAFSIMSLATLIAMCAMGRPGA